MGNKKVTLTIDGVDANEKKSSTKIQYVNPNISDDVMRGFATMCSALSTDTYTGTIKTTEEDITTPATPKPKLSLAIASAARFQLKLETASLSTAELFTGSNRPPFTYKLEGDGTILNKFSVSVYLDSHVYVGAAQLGEIAETTDKVTLTIYFEETETTAATTAQIVISYSDEPTLTIL